MGGDLAPLPHSVQMGPEQGPSTSPAKMPEPWQLSQDTDNGVCRQLLKPGFPWAGRYPPPPPLPHCLRGGQSGFLQAQKRDTGKGRGNSLPWKTRAQLVGSQPSDPAIPPLCLCQDHCLGRQRQNRPRNLDLLGLKWKRLSVRWGEGVHLPTCLRHRPEQ